MSSQEILDEVVKICQAIFEDPLLIVSPKTSAKDVAAWDSLTNLLLIDAIETRFETTFSLDEIMDTQCIGDLCELVQKKQNP